MSVTSSNTFKGLAGALALVSILTLSTQGALEIKQDEGKVKQAYLDAVKVPTICYGSTRGVRLGMIASEQECNARFSQDIKSAEADVKRYVTRPITQNQYDALVSFVFNLGGTNFKNSTLRTKINAGDCYGASKQFQRWVYAKGTKLKGLEKRRLRESELFKTGCTEWR